MNASRPKSLLCLGLLVTSSVILGGCRGHDSKPPENAALVRLINAVPDTDSLTFSVGSIRIWDHAGYRSNSGYQPVTEGSYHLGVSTERRPDPLIGQLPLRFARAKAYTIMTVGLSGGAEPPMETRVFADDLTATIPGDKARLRFINASPSVSSVDVVFDNIVGITQTAFGDRSHAVLLEGGHTYDVKIIPAGGGPDPIIGPVSVQLDGGHSYTLVSMGQPTLRPLTLSLYKDH